MGKFWGMHYGLGGNGEYTNFDILKFILGCEAWGIKQKKPSRGSAMKNMFLLPYSPKPQSQV